MSILAAIMPSTGAHPMAATQPMQPTYEQLASYDHLISGAQGKNYPLGDLNVGQVTKEMARIARENTGQVKALAEHLRGDDVRQTVFNIWHFLKTNVKFKLDKAGLEELRRPAALWADRNTGVDCDCYSIMVSALLRNLGIAHCFVLCTFDGDSGPSHVFVLARNGTEGLPVDLNMDQAFKAPDVPHSYEKTQHYEPQKLGSVPVITMQNGQTALLKPVMAAIAYLEANPYALNTNGIDTPAYKGQLQNLAAQWGNEAQRGANLWDLIRQEQHSLLPDDYRLACKLHVALYGSEPVYLGATPIRVNLAPVIARSTAWKDGIQMYRILRAANKTLSEVQLLASQLVSIDTARAMRNSGRYPADVIRQVESQGGQGIMPLGQLLAYYQQATGQRYKVPMTAPQAVLLNSVIDYFYNILDRGAAGRLNGLGFVKDLIEGAKDIWGGLVDLTKSLFKKKPSPEQIAQIANQLTQIAAINALENAKAGGKIDQAQYDTLRAQISGTDAGANAAIVEQLTGAPISLPAGEYSADIVAALQAAGVMAETVAPNVPLPGAPGTGLPGTTGPGGEVTLDPGGMAVDPNAGGGGGKDNTMLIVGVAAVAAAGFLLMGGGKKGRKKR